MTTDFLIGAVRASDLNPQVKAELEEILYRAEPVKPVKPIVYMEDDWMDAFGLDGRFWTGHDERSDGGSQAARERDQ